MSETATILLVEDNPHILRTNRRILEREGYTVLCAGTLQAARKHLAEKQPDALVLDIRLPDGSGLDFCTEVRAMTPAPVLFLTALDEKSSVIEGLVAGGSDYITKPYDVDVFLARIKAQLRLIKMNQTPSRELSYGPVRLDLIAQRAYLHEKDLLLTQKEYALLLLLMRSEGQTLSAETLYEEVWHLPMAGENRSLKKHLSGVRKKLENGGSEYTIIAVYGKGYRFGKIE